MKVIFLGTPQFAVPTLENLLNHPEFQVLGVITQPDKRRGRGSQLIPSPVKRVALDHHLPIWQPDKIKKDTALIALLKTLEVDFFVVVAYGQILSQEILEIPAQGCINVHGSILPKYRGAAPLQWCLYHGEKETGITTMLMDVGMDTGPMLLKQYAGITLLDNAVTLGDRLSELGADLLLETLLQLMGGKIEPIPQNNQEATYARLIKDEDYSIDWSRSALEIHHQIQGFYPHCVANFRGNSVKISGTIPLGNDYWYQMPADFRILQEDYQILSEIMAQPGEVIKIAKGLGPIVQTGKGLLLLRELQLSGKRLQSGSDFVNGTRLTVGELFTNFSKTDP